MKRFWIWTIPILAAISAIWIQAALHGYDPGAVTRGQQRRLHSTIWQKRQPSLPIIQKTPSNTYPGRQRQPISDSFIYLCFGTIECRDRFTKPP